MKKHNILFLEKVQDIHNICLYIYMSHIYLLVKLPIKYYSGMLDQQNQSQNPA